MLEQTCRDRGLPSPFVAPVTGGVLDASVLFLERRIGVLGLRIDRRMPEALRTLVAQSVADPAFEADIVPVSLFWGRAPGRERSWLRLLFADDWDLGGRFRKFVSLVINGRNLLVLFGDPLELQPASQETRGAVRSPRRLWRQLRTQFRNQRVATVGPDLSHRRTIVAQVLRTRAVRDAVRDEMRDEEMERRAALEKARGYAYEIAANYSHAFITFMSGVLGRLWNRLYDGVEIANLSSLEAVDEGSEIIYVPCHRSHMDYLLLSYVVYHKGHAVPHIAAGINLNMPLLGTFLRRGGAFFLRRTFAGNTLYTAVFMKYLGLMMARGHSIEYFIEGGRSRTGRLLQPRTGMLAMTVRSYLREPRRPLVFVPIYFGYERLLEGRTYISELSGRPKERESVLTLLRAIPELRSRFGKVYVSFGEPLALDALIARHAPGWNREPSGSDERPAWIAPLVAELANEIMVRINAAACATPINLVGLVLLAMPRHSMGNGDLVRQLELYASLLRQAPYSPRVWVTDMDGASMVKYAESLQLIRRRAQARRDRADDRRELGARELLPQQRAAPAADAVAACVRVPQQRDDRARRPAAARGARLSVRGGRVFPALERRGTPRPSSTSCSRTCSITVCSMPTKTAASGAGPRRDARSRAALGARAGERADHRALLSRAVAAAQGWQRTPEPGLARAPVPVNGRAHVVALRAALAGVLRAFAVRRVHRAAARTQGGQRERRRQAGLTRRRCSRRSRAMRSSCSTSRSATASCRSCTADRAGHDLTGASARRRVDDRLSINREASPRSHPFPPGCPSSSADRPACAAPFPGSAHGRRA